MPDRKRDQEHPPVADEEPAGDPRIPQAPTIGHPRPRGMDASSIAESFALKMMYSIARNEYTATSLDAFHAVELSLRDRIIDRWFLTQDAYYRHDAKRVYYLSLEFLLGRSFRSNLINLGVTAEYAEALRRMGFDLAQLEGQEPDAGLGNGGLGRLAACFLDSASTLALPFYGYGIRYEYGIFRQQIEDGRQTERPDNWLRYGNPWEVPRPDVFYPVRFYGRVDYLKDEEGRDRMTWVETQDVYAMAYDMPITGYGNDTVNSLRLWGAKSSREFDLAQFNAGEYVAAVEDKTKTENISKVLYPPDDRYAGRELRLKQQYFFVSATIQDVIRRFMKRLHHRWEDLPEKVAIQLNDTHPAVAIPELMRVLVDDQRVEWAEAWAITQRVFGYTNHTVLPEALEVWPTEIFARLLPRHLQIIQEIDRRLRLAVSERNPGEYDRVRRMAVIDDSGRSIRMTNLAIVGSHSVNGVAELHSQILKTTIFRDFHEFFPGRFNNKTNGITPRRWLLQCNPRLARLITSSIGEGWITDLEELRGLEATMGDEAFRTEWMAIKQANKIDFSQWAGGQSIVIDPETLFDCQVKRIHEYKRQLLNVMHVIALYNRIVGGQHTQVPRTVIFAGKAAPSYQMAKLIIRLIHEVAAMVRRHPEARKLLNVVFIPNYSVSCAEKVFPATELSEQISTAGMEASGTGNMKACLSGAAIIGTLDGANVEIVREVGPENIFICGHTAEDIAVLRSTGYNAREWIDRDPQLREVIETMSVGELERAHPGLFRPIVDALLGQDPYFICADFSSYLASHRLAEKAYLDRDAWTQISIMNTARMGLFSADRTVKQYASDIWGAIPVPVKLEPEKGW
jgi:starch phosphorylase